jgi:hypothetical protein
VVTPWTPPPHLPGMTAWACTRWQDGIAYAITLYASDPEQIERDWPSIRVEGRLLGWIDA